MFREINNRTILIISLIAIFVLQSCACPQKYNQLQHQYTELHTEKQTERDQYKREIKEKDEQIAELLRHIKNLENQIKELETE